MQYQDTPLSNFDLHKFIQQFETKGANIVADKDITPKTPIENIFQNRGHCILFHKYPNQNVGHWYTLLRDPNKNIFFVDSFGKDPKYYCKNLLPCLKNNGINEVIINKQKMQQDNSICGRYGVVLCCLHKLNLTVPQIYDFLEAGKKKHKSYDRFILNLTT